ncbi:MAG: adenylate kinase [Planctomycetes bacterium]|nr:adenylate kinase [Planctomycetota bacterium]
MSGRFVLLGAPGAGKGTQAKRVCTRLGVEHLSTGDLLRHAVRTGSPAGKKAKGYMDAGKLVPDEVVFSVLFERLDDGLDGFLLDGFPRNRVQAEELDRRLDAAGTPLDAVVDIDVPDEHLLGRITGRRVCKVCGNVHHVEFMRPRVEGVCDVCGGELQQRSDDRAEVVGQRLAVYREQTAPLQAYYADRGLLATVDGDRDADAITDDLLAALGEHSTEGR